ncbi:MAG: 2-amino-4-hydroxy-6-hydroxymethyldihydropteridine diphosphokinase [Chloroflexi bacterium]|nr:2-amino-4-hydroxy-6-hydroxymethyldihydropteridine diphosphokinase [Chloroflexota bacterium]
MLNEAYLGLGSNLGDAASNIRSGLETIRRHAVDMKVSSLYRTVPMGFGSQPHFLNVVCRIRTRLSPFELLHATKAIEAGLSRRRTFPNAPRNLDIDVLLYGSRSIQTRILTLPHPEMRKRPFVMVPLAELAPFLRHPTSGETFSEIARRLDHGDGLVYRLRGQA